MAVHVISIFNIISSIIHLQSDYIVQDVFKFVYQYLIKDLETKLKIRSITVQTHLKKKIYIFTTYAHIIPPL